MLEKQCPYCEDYFTARANKIHCSQRCKSAANNARVAERDKELISVEKKLKANRRIIVSIYKLYGGKELSSQIILGSKLDQRFNTRSGKHDNGERYAYFYDYSLTLLLNNNYIIKKH